jgi:tight adherence protein B
LGHVRPDLVALAAGLAAAPIGGLGGALAAAAVSALGVARWGAASRRRQDADQLAELVDALGLLVADLRVGAHPATASAAAAGASDGAVHRILGTVAAGARLGARVPLLLHQHAAAEPGIADGLSRLASAWELAERHGMGLAELVDAVRADLDARLRIGGEVRAQLAGPRATAAVLAGLPMLGVLLGQGVGAGPIRVLVDTGVGQILLVAAPHWSARVRHEATGSSSRRRGRDPDAAARGCSHHRAVPSVRPDPPVAVEP